MAVFFKIGLFSFGGGYAMVPMIENEISKNGWITSREFADIIAIAEMTPGPIAVNSATFVGYKTAGILGSLCATTGVVLPSLIIVILISSIFSKFNDKPVVKGIFCGIRPAVVALIAGAAVIVSQTSIFKGAFNAQNFSMLFTKPSAFVDIPSLAIMLGSIFVMVKLKWHPILTIFASGAAGILLFYVMNL